MGENGGGGSCVPEFLIKLGSLWWFEYKGGDYRIMWVRIGLVLIKVRVMGEEVGEITCP